MKGHSKIRNKLIANIFGQMGLVEAWGSGIRRIISAAGEYGLPVPTVEVFDDMFRVNLYRNVQDNVNGGEKGGINGGDNFGDKARIREKAQKLTDIRKVHTLYCNSVCTFGTELSVVNAHHSMIPMV